MSPQVSVARLALAVAVAAVLVVSAPFISEIRRAIRTQFPGHFVLVIGGVIGVMVGVAILAAVMRIRERRLARYGALAASVALAAGYSLTSATGIPEVDVVERFHFVEYGLVTFLFYRTWKPLRDLSIFLFPLLAGIAVGICEEWLQWFVPVRIGEMRDVFLNVVAICAGLLFSAGVDPPLHFEARLRRASRRFAGVFVACTILLFATFFHVVHLGHVVRDPETGAFLTRYSHERLLELQREKADEWRTHPPALELRDVRVSREDQYMTEGVTHVQRRNKLWDAGDITAAWLENRIAEKYFAPVLDTPSYVSKTGHRWPAEQRADAAGRAGDVRAAAATYSSEANPYPIYPWPRPLVWGLALVLASAAIGGSMISGKP